jgi:predicted outer membrane repeat protein
MRFSTPYGSTTHSQYRVQINNTAFYSNTAQYQGGAIYLHAYYGNTYRYFQLQVCILNTTFHSNTVLIAT